jgi:TatD DNase family protein
MFDSHCHLDFAAYDADREAVWKRACECGVTACHVPGVAPAQWLAASELRRLDPAIGCSVGVHPWWLAKLRAPEVDAALHQLGSQARRLGAEAIGECGLDRATEKRDGVALARQTDVLDGHLEVARDLGLPLVLHVFGAHGAALAALRRHGPLRAGGVLHSYSGPAEMVPDYAALGLSFSFAANVTRDNARRPLEAARVVPSDRLLVESDGPDQPLTGYARSEPAHLPTIVDALAAARGEPPESVAETMAGNAARLFARTA